MKRLLFGIVVVLVTGMFCRELFGAEAALDLKGVRILVCSPYSDLLSLPAVQRLKAAGAEVRQGSLDALTWDQASKFHLIIAVNEPEPQQPKDGEGPVAVLAKFVKAGGGLLFFKNFYGNEGADKYLAPFGASVPYEIIQDPSHTWTEPLGWGFTYDCTKKITAGDPITEGVKTIWYPAQRGHENHTWPIKVDQNWKVLVTAEPEASSLWVGGLNEEEKSRPGIYPSAPPFVASRTDGKGSIILVGISPFEMFMGQGLPVYMDILLEKGNGLLPSDTGRLYVNAMNWLAARALAAAKAEPAEIKLGQGNLPPLNSDAASVPDWSKDVTGGDWCTNPAHGVIGAHSTLSDGKAAPEALIAKAKALGLNWIGFTERLEQFSPEKWERLRKICKDATTPQFSALPGLDYADQNGTRYVVFGDFNWPPDKVFSPDKQRIIGPIWWFNIGNVPLGPYDISHAPLRYWDLTLYNMYPIRTTIGGKQVDENLEGYRYMHGLMDDPFPMAVDMFSDEAGLEAASKRMLTYLMQDMSRDIQKFYTDHYYYTSYYGFVSDGPVVTDWHAANAARYTLGKWWLPGTEKYRVRLSVHSVAAITDIKIYDGPVLFRRFKPNQAKVVLTFDAPHDMQHNLTADITDVNGKRAITGGIHIQDYSNHRYMCGDRGNCICDGVQVDEFGAYLTSPTAPYQEKMAITSFGLAPGFGDRPFLHIPPEFDGGMRFFVMWPVPLFQIPGFQLFPVPAGVTATPESRNQIPVCSRDGLLQGDDIVGYFPGTTTPWDPKPAPKDVEGLHISYRYLDITARAHDPGVVLVEGKVRFDKPMTINSACVFSMPVATQRGEGDLYALNTPGLTVTGMAAGEPYSASGKAVPGSYAMLFPSPSGSGGVMTLDDGYQLYFVAKTGHAHIQLSMDNLPRQMKAGDELSYRYLTLRGQARELPNTAEWDSFAQALGLRGKPAYEVKDVKVGTVQGTKFLLELVPADSGFVGTVTQANLPIRLPVRVTNMNPNWTFAWFDLDRKEWYPSALDRVINQGYFTLDTRQGNHRFFAGHPVLADNPGVRIAVFSDAKSAVSAALNNVGDQPLKLTVRLNPALGVAPPQSVELAPGELKSVTFALAVK